MQSSVWKTRMLATLVLEPLFKSLKESLQSMIWFEGSVNREGEGRESMESCKIKKWRKGEYREFGEGDQKIIWGGENKK